MKKLIGITLVAALLIGGISFVSKMKVTDPGGGGLTAAAYDPGGGGLSPMAVKDPGGGGL